MSDVFCHLLIKRKDDKHALTEDHHVLACFLLFSVFVQSILKSFILPLPHFCYCIRCMIFELTVHCIFIYYCHLDEDKPLFIYTQSPFLNEAGFQQSGKIRRKREILREIRGNKGKPDRIRKPFRGLLKFVFSRLSQIIFILPEFLESCTCEKPLHMHLNFDALD